MTLEPPILGVECFKRPDLSQAALWTDPILRPLLTSMLNLRPVESLEALAESASVLAVAGGGAMMDEAKFFRTRHAPGLFLVLIPTIWGSGAEASPIVVLNRDGTKQIQKDESFLPDAIVYLPELGQTVPPERARHACGDVWSHALEAFLSPLATPELQDELAALIARILRLPLGYHPDWFTESARACRLQAAASVGFVHGIAHTLEGPLRAAYPRDDWGHAKLCSIFLPPVMALNRATSAKWDSLCCQYGLDSEAIWRALRALFEPKAYNQALTVLGEQWLRVLRDPSTRTNSVLVRAKHLAWLEQYEAQ